MSLKDIISPIYVWKRAFSKAFTTKKPLEERPGAKRYRGFHKNDMEKCIGCGSCEEICQNAAIDLVPVKGIETTDGDSGLRPKIDYGRCCWCALCVDICPTNSLSMSNEYIWIDEDAEEFRFVAGNEDKPWDDMDKGYERTGDYRLTVPERIEMEMVDPDEGLKSFREMVKGYSKEQAQKEADRCVECGICVATCPAHMDIPRYIKAIREDDMDTAVELLYKTNPLPATCGRICTRKCETACAIGADGEPVAIRWLKRYIIDRVEDKKVREILRDKIYTKRDEKIAIIGAGPGGLSAAYYLITMGYQVTIYEAHSKPGGEIWYGVPEYRMPYKNLQEEIDHIIELGVDIKFQHEVGTEIKFDKLYEEFDAIFISTGLTDPYNLRLEGETLPGVLPGLEFLEKVAEGEKIDVGDRVMIIGGGNVAIDAARTSRRLGADAEILYRRREVDMPADEEEIHEAKLENVIFTCKAIPVKIETEKDELKMTWGKAQMIDQGPNKRPKPKIIPGDSHTSLADTIISAIGQKGEYDFIPEEIRKKIDFKRNRIVTDANAQTGEPKIFAGGDIVNYTRDAISAIADGHKAAKGIDKFIRSMK